MGPPNKKDRDDIFRVHLHRIPCSSDVCISELSHLTEGYTGADISLICREAAIRAIEVCKALSPNKCYLLSISILFNIVVSKKNLFVISGEPLCLRNHNGTLESWNSASTAI